ncbi:hypothetical protein DL240_16140 [Lujinxingia litoralis]|uniref:Uncharacterized protein n=1 Tax=Lujinxingia litoralis TaxID=2211119 RepID=A0A328C3R7_9DELT|nr:hypothetical protein [Lujinxingia litoralis]RAL20566.1 hypothetical protein DL240_16140 [Lujinxingia litoralis]
MEISRLEAGWGDGDIEAFSAALEEHLCAALSGAAQGHDIGAVQASMPPSQRTDAPPASPPPGRSPTTFGARLRSTLEPMVVDAMRNPEQARTLAHRTLEALTDLQLERFPVLNVPGARQSMMSTMGSDPYVLRQLSEVLIDLADELAHRARSGRMPPNWGDE